MAEAEGVRAPAIAVFGPVAALASGWTGSAGAAAARRDRRGHARAGAGERSGRAAARRSAPTWSRRRRSGSSRSPASCRPIDALRPRLPDQPERRAAAVRAACGTGLDARALAGARVAAIGPGTAAALREHGVIADVVPERFVAEGLVEALADVPVSRALVARAAEARDVLPDALRERGAEVDVVALYETVAEPLSPAQLEAALAADYVTFTSSSTVRFWCEAAGEAARRSGRLVSIGPVTSDALARARARAGRRGRAARHRRAGAGAGGGRVRLTRVSAPVITFLSDYGLEDDFVGVCHGVIARICPEARVIDITHGVRAPRRSRRGADPARRAAVHAGRRPPRGRRSGRRRATAARSRCGPPTTGCSSGPTTACCGSRPTQPAASSRRSRSRARRGGSSRSSATFHGRDIFAPVAARLAAGEPLAQAGEPCDPAQLVQLELPRPRAGGRRARRERDLRRPVRQRAARRRPRGSRRRARGQAGLTGRASRRRSHGRQALTTRGRSPTSAQTSCCSTRTPTGRWRSPSASGSAAERLGLAVGDAARDQAGVSVSAARGSTCASSTRPTSARASSPAPARRTGRS